MTTLHKTILIFSKAQKHTCGKIFSGAALGPPEGGATCDGAVVGTCLVDN